MKKLYSNPISPFGGLNFVLEELDKKNIGSLLNQYLPKLSNQSRYSWKDVFQSYWSIFFCGGDCAEDLKINLVNGFSNNPFICIPSPDRLLSRLKELSEPSQKFKKNRSEVFNEFSFNNKLNRLNIRLLKVLGFLTNSCLTLDYDNTFLYHNKADAKRTYTKHSGYCPGVAVVGNNVVFIENRNGNCAPHTLQEDTLRRMFQLLKADDINIDVFRADSASYQFETINVVNEYVNRFYTRAVINSRVMDAISSINKWTEYRFNGKTYLRGEAKFTPFVNTAKKLKKEHLLKQYRLIVTKEPRNDGQLNVFSGEAVNYSSIITNDFDSSMDDVVEFYNQRGRAEKEFDVLKNDFGWRKLPFSKIEYNTVYLLVTAMCRNIYDYIIRIFSKSNRYLKSIYRIKKFIFRFICVPAKWVKSGRTLKLRVFKPPPE